MEAIAKVPGLDLMFVGPGDLGVRLKQSGGNVPGAAYYFDGSMPEAMERIAAAAKDAECAWGLPVGTKDDAEQRFRQGARFINLGGDFGFCMQGLERDSGLMDAAFGDK